jgi:hypothetical protein
MQNDHEKTDSAIQAEDSGETYNGIVAVADLPFAIEGRRTIISTGIKGRQFHRFEGNQGSFGPQNRRPSHALVPTLL